MKSILFLILIFAAHFAAAQTHIRTSEEAKKEKFHPDMLPVTYEEKSNDEAMHFVEKSLNAVIAKDANPGIMAITQILINGEGSIDYIIFDLKTKDYNIDSLNQIVKKSFIQHASNWKLIKKPEKPFRLMMLITFGKQTIERQVRKTDSSVVDIKEAMACIDTLKVKRIFFNQLGLKTVPEVVYRFPNAEELYLDDNGMEKAAIDITRLPHLKQLHLKGNKLTNGNLDLTKNQYLELLDLRENNFTDIPKAARANKRMSALWLGGNKLTSLSNRSFRKLKQVKDLNFYKSGLSVLPKGIQKMKNLEVLDLYHNQFETLPNSLTKLKKLTQLAVSYNQLKVLPKDMDRLKNVHTFYAHHNQLSKLPEGITRMQKINILDLGYNGFTAFPDQIAALDSLHELDISANNLPEFPAKLLELKKLNKLYLRGNPFVGKDMDKKYVRQLNVLKSKNVEVFY